MPAAWPGASCRQSSTDRSISGEKPRPADYAHPFSTGNFVLPVDFSVENQPPKRDRLFLLHSRWISFPQVRSRTVGFAAGLSTPESTDCAQPCYRFSTSYPQGCFGGRGASGQNVIARCQTLLVGRCRRGASRYAGGGCAE